MDFNAVLQFIVAQAQKTVIGVDGVAYAVEITDPIGFSAYMGLAFVLYAIRETNYIPIRFMPLIAIFLGLLYAGFVEYKAFDERSIVAGLRLGLLGIGSVATVKYFFEKPNDDNSQDSARVLKE